MHAVPAKNEIVCVRVCVCMCVCAHLPKSIILIIANTTKISTHKLTQGKADKKNNKKTFIKLLNKKEPKKRNTNRSELISDACDTSSLIIEQTN